MHGQVNVIGIFYIIFFALKTFAIPQIDINNFNEEEMLRVLTNVGSFELIGVDDLASVGINALSTAKEILSLEIQQLERVNQESFHGFQNVRRETMSKWQLKKDAGEDLTKFPIRNQIAYHYKPYREHGISMENSKIPLMDQGMPVDVMALNTYYSVGMTVLHRLYKQIADAFIPNFNKSNLEDDMQSVLTCRRYFNGVEGETGIPEHSDYGLLTLVISDKPGLEVKSGETWISAPSKPKLRFYVNIGDWLLFQIGRPDFKAGLHRVPEIEKERYSMALFLNPPLSEEQETPKGGRVPYKSFLFSDKTPYK